MDVISYKEGEEALLLSCVVEKIRSLHPSLTPGPLFYLAVIHKYSLRNLCYPFIPALVDSHNVAYKTPHLFEFSLFSITVTKHHNQGSLEKKV